MGRPLRIEFAGACYHVFGRGNRRQVVFHEPRDYALFLAKLARFAGVFRVQVRSFCLLANHYHLYLCTPEPNLSRFMHSLLTSFTLAANRRAERPGHLFQGRFKSRPVEDGAYGAALSRYIHLNPCRDGPIETAPAEVRIRVLRGYPWSSYAATVGLRRSPAWLDPSEVLRSWGTDPESRRAGYAAFVEGGLGISPEPFFMNPQAGSILGSEEYMERIRGLLGPAAEGTRLRREVLEQERLRGGLPFDRVLDATVRSFGAESKDILQPHARNSAPRQVLLFLASILCRGRHTLAELAERTGIGSSGLAAGRRRLEARMREEPELKRRVEGILQELQGGVKPTNRK